jgi:hypothetical protein
MKWELCLAIADNSGLCLVVVGSSWFVIIPKSMDRLMEPSPMKIVQT